MHVMFGKGSFDPEIRDEFNRTLAEMELRNSGIDRVMTHGEKSAVYMADGFARVSGRPGVTFAQCVGAANLAAALRDPYLACSPMVAVTL